MNKKISVLRRVVAMVANRKFFWAVLALFVLQAAWIALSGRYPMAFDEDFHLGIIKLYTHHISPFWAGQPENADMFGAVARDPSYLYQYLMSFPYRLINLFTRDQTIIVIILRFIGIGLFGWGLVLFRKLLLKTGVHRAVVHLCLLAFVLLPIVPLLAAQINYDIMLFPAVAASLLLTLKFDASLLRKQLDIKALFQLLIVCLLGCIVKYAFLPIFVAIVGFVAVRLWQSHRFGLTDLTASWRPLGRWMQTGLFVGLVVAAGLFSQRIGYNMVRYHTPVPDCDKVLSVEQCSEYGPWARNYNDKLNKIDGATATNPVIYTGEWFYGMWLRTFFAVGGPDVSFQTRGPLKAPALGSILFGSVGIIGFIMGAKRVFRRYDKPAIWLFLVVAGSYVGVLWLDEYQAFLRTGQPVAINGRYLLPVLLLLLVPAAAALAQITRKRPHWQLILALVPVLCLAWGGGALTFILRSGDAWYWNNNTVRSANHAVQRTLGPITPGYSQKTEYLR